MKSRAMKAIIKKDIRAISSSVQLWLPMLLIPVIFSMVLPGVIIIPARFTDLSTMGNMDPIIDLFAQLPPGQLRESILSLDTTNKQLIYFAVNYLFAPFFLIIPLMTASVIGANSFAGEKERKTMESLLFAPVELSTLFWAKILSAFLPACGVTFLCSLLYGLMVNLAAYPLFGALIFPQSNWVILILWVTPALSLGTVFLNVLISSKVKGFQEAYQLGGVAILPILALLIGQFAGLLLVNAAFLFWVGVGLCLIDLVLIKSVEKRLNRNKLFTSQV
ncbi:MAG TPA: hypothetical protein DD734_06370 [Firmicutes bacterium]|nr:hypothetical protein [Bacillota bacterium]HBR34239.1 hypothetical protein [Bacillota bacterium]